MRYVCDQGCVVDVGMSKPAPGICETHGSAFVYEKQLRRTKPMRRVSEGRAPEARRRGSTLKRGKGFEASPAQRAKVKGMPCLGCGREATEDGSVVIDPAHVWPQGKGGCEHPDCVIPLCRVVFDGSGCHCLFDEGKLDLLERMAGSEAWAVEQAHPILVHGVGLVELVRRLSGDSYEFVKAESPATEQVG